MNERQAPENIHNAPTIGDNSPQAHASANVGVGMFISIMALILASFGSGMAVTALVIMPGMIEAKVNAGVAEAKAEISKELAAANEQANSARTFGRLANDKADRVLAHLEVRGLVKQENH